MTARLLAVSLMLLCATSLTSATPEVAFETVTLRNLTAGEAAPLLGAKFRFVGPSGEWTRQSDSGAGATLVPRGIDLITAGHQSSSQLLVAGTAQAVAELKMLLAQVDTRPAQMQLTAQIYPVPPDGWANWQAFPAMGGFGVRVNRFRAGTAPRFSVLPASVRPTTQAAVLSNLRPEYLALPPYGNLPQVVLCVQPKMNAGGGLGLSFGVGALAAGGSPAAAAEAARAMPAIVSVKKGEKLALALERNRAVVTIVLSFGAAR
jgi:hypothetical protein